MYDTLETFEANARLFSSSTEIMGECFERIVECIAELRDENTQLRLRIEALERAKPVVIVNHPDERDQT